MNIFLIIVGIALAIAAIVMAVVTASKNSYRTNKTKNPLTKVLAILSVVLIIFGSSFAIIPTGYTGVRTTFGQVSQTALSSGFNFKIPFIQSIKKVNNKQQDEVFADAIWGETNEKTPVYGSNITVTYQVSSEKSTWLYTHVTDVDNLITRDLVASAFKMAAVNFNAQEVTMRNKVEPLMAEKLQESLISKYGENTITIIKITIDNMDFEDSYNQAIAEKSIAIQNQQKQEIINETAIAKAEADKKVMITNAEAEAKAKEIAAEAEANANKKIKESLSKEVLESKFYEKWDGKLPQAMGSDTIITSVSDGSSE